MNHEQDTNWSVATGDYPASNTWYLGDVYLRGNEVDTLILRSVSNDAREHSALMSVSKHTNIAPECRIRLSKWSPKGMGA